MLREAPSRVGPLALRLRREAHFFQEGPSHKKGCQYIGSPGGFTYMITIICQLIHLVIRNTINSH